MLLHSTTRRSSDDVGEGWVAWRSKRRRLDRVGGHAQQCIDGGVPPPYAAATTRPWAGEPTPLSFSLPLLPSISALIPQPAIDADRRSHSHAQYWMPPPPPTPPFPLYIPELAFPSVYSPKPATDQSLPQISTPVTPDRDLALSPAAVVPIKVQQSARLRLMLVTQLRNLPVPLAIQPQSPSGTWCLDPQWCSLRSDLVRFIRKLASSFSYHSDTAQHAVSILDRALGVLAPPSLPVHSFPFLDLFSGIYVRTITATEVSLDASRTGYYWLAAATAFHLAAAFAEEEREPSMADVCDCSAAIVPSLGVAHSHVITAYLITENVRTMARRIPRWLGWNLMCVTPSQALEELIRGSIVASCRMEVASSSARTIAVPRGMIPWRSGWDEPEISPVSESERAFAQTQSRSTATASPLVGGAARKQAVYSIAEILINDALLLPELVGTPAVTVAAAAVACAVAFLYEIAAFAHSAAARSRLEPQTMRPVSFLYPLCEPKWRWMMAELASLIVAAPESNPVLSTTMVQTTLGQLHTYASILWRNCALPKLEQAARSHRS